MRDRIEVVAEALRMKILDSAVRGELVPQDPKDEPASVLLELIAKEREEKSTCKRKGKQITSRIVRRANGTFELFADGEEKDITDEIPYDTPDSWEWVRLNDICSYIQRGKSPKYSSVRKYPVISQKCNQWSGFSIERARFLEPESYSKYEKNRILRDGDLLLNSTGTGTIGRVAIYFTRLNPYGVAVADSHVTVIRTYPREVLSQYIFAFLASPAIQSRVEKNADGSTNQIELSLSTIKDFLIPLPPLAEQKRIAEALESRLHQLDTLRSMHQRIQRVLRDTPTSLRQQLLQAAITGKLVAQDPKDEPASVLLERIAKEREEKSPGKRKGKQISSRIVRRNNGTFELFADGAEKDIADEIPFDIPDAWEWVRLRDICAYIQRGKSPKYSTIQKYPVISQKCNQWTGFSIEKAKFIDPETYSKYEKDRILRDGDLLLNSTGIGTIGRVAIYFTRLNPYGVAVADSHVTVIRMYSEEVLSQFIYAFLASPVIQSKVEKNADGSTNQIELSLSTIEDFVIPFPPIAEQKRIVAHLEKLLAQLDRLE